MGIEFNKPGLLTKGAFTGWYVVVQELSTRDQGYLIIYSKQNLFDETGQLEAVPGNEVYDEFLLTLQEVIHAIEEDRGVIWLSD